MRQPTSLHSWMMPAVATISCKCVTPCSVHLETSGRCAPERVTFVPWTIKDHDRNVTNRLPYERQSKSSVT